LTHTNLRIGHQRSSKGSFSC